MSVADEIAAGDTRAAARLMRDLDDRMPGSAEALRELYPRTGRARIVGVTGNPGSGKSTLVDALVALHRKRGERVGVVAVDPSSPYSGGAILGDRIRMQRHALDPGVFIRSLASRGHLGGLSRSTTDVVSVMDAMGMDVIFIETVGVGQAEVEIVEAAHLSVVVVVPGLGDEVQAIKSGILEIADVLCVNKADREGADRAAADLEMMLGLRAEGIPRPPIVRTVAPVGKGVPELAAALDVLAAGREEAEWHARILRRARRQVEDLLRERSLEEAVRRLGPRLDELVDLVARRERDPYSVVEEILADFSDRPSSVGLGWIPSPGTR
jgi:LAO/AO transport system kinase